MKHVGGDLSTNLGPDLPPHISATRGGVRLEKEGQMKRARLTEEQIIGVLRELEAGAKAVDLARKHGVTKATVYNWKAKYGSKYGRVDVPEAKRMQQLEEENVTLKKLLADQMLLLAKKND
jgi:putative transposase